MMVLNQKTRLRLNSPFEWWWWGGGGGCHTKCPKCTSRACTPSRNVPLKMISAIITCTEREDPHQMMHPLWSGCVWAGVGL